MTSQPGKDTQMPFLLNLVAAIELLGLELFCIEVAPSGHFLPRLSKAFFDAYMGQPKSDVCC
jgi:hypothetical protein